DADNSFDALPTLENVSGAATITEIKVLLDGVVVDDQTTAPSASLFIGAQGPVLGTGNHTLTIQLAQQTTTTPTAYTLPKFNVDLFACVGTVGGFFVVADDGGTSRTIKMPAQSGNLVAGQGFNYTFYSPDCVMADDDKAAGRRRAPHFVVPGRTPLRALGGSR